MKRKEPFELFGSLEYLCSYIQQFSGEAKFTIVQVDGDQYKLNVLVKDKYDRWTYFYKGE